MIDSTIITGLLEDGMFAAMAAIGFSTISHTPRRTYMVCAIAAAAGHSLRSLLVMPCGGGLNIIVASVIAAFVVGVVAVLLAPKVKVPAEACLFPALLPMIPGMYAYRAVEGMVGCLTASAEASFSHSMYVLAFNGMTCVGIVVGMVLGANIPIFLFKNTSFQATR